jgi:hypothetical protein
MRRRTSFKAIFILREPDHHFLYTRPAKLPGFTTIDAFEWPSEVYALELYSQVDIVEGGKVYTGECTKIGPVYFNPSRATENRSGPQLQALHNTVEETDQ